MLSLISLLLASAPASAASLQTGAARRRQLLESHLNGPVPRPLPVDAARGRPRSTLQPTLRSLQQAIVPTAQSLAAQDVPDLEAAKRPLRMAFYNRLDDTRSKTEQNYIMDTLIPATAAVLRRSMRVRLPGSPPAPLAAATCTESEVQTVNLGLQSGRHPRTLARRVALQVPLYMAATAPRSLSMAWYTCSTFHRHISRCLVAVPK